MGGRVPPDFFVNTALQTAIRHAVIALPGQEIGRPCHLAESPSLP
jgi:hypothetical protein